MIIRFDEFLIRLAKKMILVASFFGISRKLLVIFWIFFSSIVLFSSSFGWIDLSFGVVVGLVIGSITTPVALMTCYREDDVVPNDPLLTSRNLRIFFFLYWYLVSYYGVKWPPDYVMMVIKICSLYFWPYFCLNQNQRCKMTARDWLIAIKKALQSKPSAQPVPQPVPASFSARN